ncbi:MAG: hypothetical protein U1F61_20150 [Opitutaceae bacterium]
MTTTWARRLCRISWSNVLPTPSSSPSGTARSSTASRSRWPREVGVGTRGGYEQSGALRDMIQNHTMQLLAPTAGRAWSPRCRGGSR